MSLLATLIVVLVVWLAVAGLALAVMAAAKQADEEAQRESAKLPRSGEGRNLPHAVDWRRAGHRDRRGGGGTAS